MKKGIIGKKLGMTQIFTENGQVIPVTVIEAGPCAITQKKTVETDGYNAVQLAFEEIREKLVNKPRAGHFKKAGVSARRHLKEFRLEDIESLNVGDTISADTFASGDKVDIDLFIIVEYGISISAVAAAIIETVKYKVEHYTGIPVGRVNVCVEDIRV